MKIKIFQTSDVHSYMYAHNYVKNEKQGLLGFKNYIDETREKNEVILIDSGDMFQGSPLSYYVYKNISKFNTHPITNQLNDLKYDVLTLGNHEFNYGKDYLKLIYSSFDGDVVVANASRIESTINQVKPYTIIERSGFKIAVIGLVTKYIPNWEKPDNINGFKFESIIDTYAKYEEEMIEKSDMIVVNYHGGFECALNDLNVRTEKMQGENEGAELLKRFSSIDILLSGHQHREICQVINGVVCVQPLNNAKKISEITIDINDDKEYSIEANLIENQGIDTIANIELEKLEENVQKYLDKKVGKSNIDMRINDIFEARKNSHPLVNFLNTIQLEVSKADVSAVSLFDSAIGFSTEITIRDVVANYPFPNTLNVIEVTKDDIKEALEICASYFEKEDDEIVPSKIFTQPKAQHYNYDIFAGVQYEININNAVGSRITKLDFVNKDVDESKIKLVINNYRATNYEWYPMYENKKLLQDINVDMSELIIDYILEKKTIQVDTKASFSLKD